MLTFSSLLVLALLQIDVAIAKSRIRFLPGIVDFKELKYRQYSGYFRATKAHFLHYWFIESENDPKNDPVIFWFNGGPGCSSMHGALEQHGPLVLEPDGKTFRRNPYAWTKKASVVYTESPPGVGFSFTTDGQESFNDDQTAEENYAAIKDFFVQYPKFRNHSIYIAGESYAGVYVSVLSSRIIDGQANFSINLKGILLGNAVVDDELNEDTRLRFAYAHGMVDEQLWDEVQKKCCNGCMSTCNLESKDHSDACQKMIEELSDVFYESGLNSYDLRQRCATDKSLAYNNMYLKKSNWRKRNLFYQSSSVPCLNGTKMLVYLNEIRVRRAMNIPDNVKTWDICDAGVAFAYKKLYSRMDSFIKKIVNNNIRVLLYYGDTDTVCNFIMGQQFAERLKFKMVKRKKPWYLNGKLAGMQTLYKGLTFLTILGAGHMAAQTRAPQTQHAVHQFIAGKPIGN